MFCMRFVHISHDDKLLKTRARHIHTIQLIALEAVYIAPRDFCTPLLIDVSDRGLKLHAQMQLCKYNSQYGAKRGVWFYITK